MTYPRFRQTVFDTTDARRSAEFWRELMGLEYREGDEPPPAGAPDPQGGDWLVLLDGGRRLLAFQQVPELPAVTWPSGPVPQQLHLDLLVESAQELQAQRQRALALGAEQLMDRSADPEEPLYVFADPDGHPFCIFIGPENASPDVENGGPAPSWG